MTTQKELLGEHRAGLDERFKEKYPDGRFTLQEFHGTAIHWCHRRPTSHTRYRGISTYLAQNGTIRQEKWQNSSFGKCWSYDSLNKMLTACEKRGVAKELIDAFVARYDGRGDEGF